MLSVSRLLCGLDDGGRPDGTAAGPDRDRDPREQRAPTVVWELTGRRTPASQCGDAGADPAAPGELSTAEGERLLDDLADYGVPTVVFAGGEPAVRGDLRELVARAAANGIRTVLATDGRLLSPERAASLRDAGLASVEISVDALPERRDRIRGEDGAFDAAVRGLEACREAGLETGIRYTIGNGDRPDLEEMVERFSEKGVAFFAEKGVDRICFSHPEYCGRDDAVEGLDPETRREAVDRICDLARSHACSGAIERSHARSEAIEGSHAHSEAIEIQLGGNRADAAYLVEYARRTLGEERAARVYRRLRRHASDRSRERAGIDCQGNVRLTPSWRGYSLGNVRDRPFGAIWESDANPLLAALRDPDAWLSGRCGECGYRSVCRGASRRRAFAGHGDPFAPDPQCYLRAHERSPDAGFEPPVESQVESQPSSD